MIFPVPQNQHRVTFVRVHVGALNHALVAIRRHHLTSLEKALGAVRLRNVSDLK
jgi:hypothetical protein